MDDDAEPTQAGLLCCLDALSNEAAALGLPRTFAALQDAIALCRAEADMRPFSFRPPPPALAVH